MGKAASGEHHLRGASRTRDDLRVEFLAWSLCAHGQRIRPTDASAYSWAADSRCRLTGQFTIFSAGLHLDARNDDIVGFGYKKALPVASNPCASPGSHSDETLPTTRADYRHAQYTLAVL